MGETEVLLFEGTKPNEPYRVPQFDNRRITPVLQGPDWRNRRFGKYFFPPKQVVVLSCTRGIAQFAFFGKQT